MTFTFYIVTKLITFNEAYFIFYEPKSIYFRDSTAHKLQLKTVLTNILVIIFVAVMIFWNSRKRCLYQINYANPPEVVRLAASVKQDYPERPPKFFPSLFQLKHVSSRTNFLRKLRRLLLQWVILKENHWWRSWLYNKVFIDGFIYNRSIWQTIILVERNKKHIQLELGRLLKYDQHEVV